MDKRKVFGGGLCAALLLVGGVWTARGQVGEGITVEYPHVEQPHLTAEGGNVRVKFRMVIPARNIQQNKTIEMVPVLANRGGESSMTPIMVTGHRKDLSDLRKRVLSGTNMAVMMHVVKGQAGVLDYNVSIPYEEWMSGGDLKLYLDQSKIGYHKSLFLGRIPLLMAASDSNGSAGLTVENVEQLTAASAQPAPAVGGAERIADDFYSRLSALLSANDWAGARSLLEHSGGSEPNGLRTLFGEGAFRELLGRDFFLSADSTGVRVRMAPFEEQLSASRALSLRETFMADRAQYERDSLGFADDATGLSVYFRAGYRTLDPVYGDNGATLDRILAAIGTVQRDPRSRLLCIRIVGQASPEGSGPVNEVLSQKRGEALRDYLQGRSGVSASCFDVRSRGAAWAALRKLVEEDAAVPHREEVLDVIDHTPVWDSRRQLGRMSALWRIDGERAYWYMYRNLFPKLRNASYVKLYFDDDADRNFVVIGRASELIAAGDYAGALAVLEPVRDDLRALPALAVCSAMTGDAAAAREYLRKVGTAAAGDPDGRPSGCDETNEVEQAKK